jgi:P27 family predicted phage terminase small subunit
MQDYLTKRGKKIYKEIEKHVKDRGLSEAIDSFELSMLANAFDMHHEAAKELNEKGYTQKAPNSNYTQVKGEFTVMQRSWDYINKNGGKFGLNPEAREKIKAFTKKEDKPKSKLDKLRN